MIALPRTRRLRLLREEPRARTAAFVLVVGVLTGVAMLLFPPAVVSYNVGVVADRSVKAPRSVSFVSESLTQAERERAVVAVPQQYKRDPSVAVAETGRLAATVATIDRLRADASLGRDQKIVALTRISETAITGPLAVELVDMGAEWEPLARDLEKALGSIYSQGIRAEQLEQAKADLPKALPAAWTDRQRRIASALIGPHLKANELLDPAMTVAAQAAARSAVSPVQVQVMAGEVVVREGSVVTPQDVEKLRKLGLASTGVAWTGALGLFGWAL
ncbi:MAG: hypothetical protein AAB114_06310, partial [Chloroflexota bacterium]